MLGHGICKTSKRISEYDHLGRNKLNKRSNEKYSGIIIHKFFSKKYINKITGGIRPNIKHEDSFQVFIQRNYLEISQQYAQNWSMLLWHGHHLEGKI